MATKVVCDLCDNEIHMGENAAKRNMSFSMGDSVHLPVVTVTLSAVRVEGIVDPDVCIPCLKKVVEA